MFCRHWTTKASVRCTVQVQQRRRRTTMMQTGFNAEIVFYAFRPDLAKKGLNNTYLNLRSFC